MPGARKTIPSPQPTAQVAIAGPTRIVAVRDGDPFVATPTTPPSYRRSCGAQPCRERLLGDVTGEGDTLPTLVRRVPARAAIAHVPSLRRGEAVGVPAA